MSRDLSYLSKYQSSIDDSEYNVQTGLAFPRVSCGNNRFTAFDEEGNESLLGVDSFEFIVIRSNPHNSKVYYGGPYDPANSTPPNCFSDNGFSPDTRVYEPQALYCHECPKGQWGSATSNLSGKATKACSDYRKLAVFVVHDEIEGLHQFRIPSASLQNWAKYLQDLMRFPTGGPKLQPHHVLTRAKWSKTRQNVLEFERVDFLDEDWLEVIISHQNGDEYLQWIGMDQVSQQRRQLESQKLRPAPQIESHQHRPISSNQQSNPDKVIDVEPEKATPAPRRKPGQSKEDPKQEAASRTMRKPGLVHSGEGRVSEAPPASMGAPVETAIERAKRRAQERIATETGRA